MKHGYFLMDRLGCMNHSSKSVSTIWLKIWNLNLNETENENENPKPAQTLKRPPLTGGAQLSILSYINMCLIVNVVDTCVLLGMREVILEIKFDNLICLLEIICFACMSLVALIPDMCIDLKMHAFLWYPYNPGGRGSTSYRSWQYCIIWIVSLRAYF